MPYRIGRRGDEYCVIKIGTDESMGCHPTRTEALDHRAAILANEEAENPEAVLMLSLAAEAREQPELAAGEYILGAEAVCGLHRQEGEP